MCGMRSPGPDGNTCKRPGKYIFTLSRSHVICNLPTNSKKSSIMPFQSHKSHKVLWMPEALLSSAKSLNSSTSPMLYHLNLVILLDAGMQVPSCVGSRRLILSERSVVVGGTVSNISALIKTALHAFLQLKGSFSHANTVCFKLSKIIDLVRCIVRIGRLYLFQKHFCKYVKFHNSSQVNCN